MPPFPPIQRLCPYLDRLDEVIDAGFCRMCSREVHDLTAMDARDRTDFLAARGGDACVSYTMHVKPALAAALIAASAAVLAPPDAAQAAEHRAARNPQAGRPPHRPRPIQESPVMIRTAGVPAMPLVNAPRHTAPPAPPAESQPPHKSA